MKSQEKSLQIFWSKAAFDRAGDDFRAIRRALTDEVREVAAGTSDWFLHVIAPEGWGDEAILLCRGGEGEDLWTVAVQLGEYVDIDVEPEPGRPPLEETLGYKPSMPVAVDGEDNERFAEIAEES